MARTIKGLCFTLVLAFLIGRGKVFGTPPMEQIKDTLQQMMNMISGPPDTHVDHPAKVSSSR